MDGKALKGVNLGGWLLLERWMTPSLFDATGTDDEYTLCERLGDKKYELLQSHRDNFITRDDFEWLAERVEAIRLPVGYWALEDDGPYLNCRQWLDSAFEWAQESNLKVLLDLHGAPGSQNGNDHSGRKGDIDWVENNNIEQSLAAISELAKTYGSRPNLYGIELLNEPGWDVPLELLKDFYIKGYDAVREFCGPETAVVISDAFRPDIWNGFMSRPDFENIVLDMHLYQCFGRHDKRLSLPAHLEKARRDWREIIRQSDKPVTIGEWSLGLDEAAFKGMDESEKKAAKAAYAAAQLDGFSASAGWFFWSYKTQSMPDWDFRYCVENGIIIL